MRRRQTPKCTSAPPDRRPPLRAPHLSQFVTAYSRNNTWGRGTTAGDDGGEGAAPPPQIPAQGVGGGSSCGPHPGEFQRQEPEVLKS